MYSSISNLYILVWAHRSSLPAAKHCPLNSNQGVLKNIAPTTQQNHGQVMFLRCALHLGTLACDLGGGSGPARSIWHWSKWHKNDSAKARHIERGYSFNMLVRQ